MRMKNKKWSKPYLQQNETWIYNKENLLHSDWSSLQEKDHLCLEIGTGKGDFISTLAEKNPHTLYLGVEKVPTCLAITGKKVETKKLENVRLFDGDIMELFPLLKPGTFQTIYLNFSDPWPKKRHTKRRLTFDTFLMQYARLLKEDGQLIMKTDNENLFRYSLQNLQDFGWNVTQVDEDYDGKEENDCCTEYEAYFRELHQPIYRLVASKPVPPTEYAMFYDYKKTGDVLKIVKDGKKDITCSKRVGQVTVYYHDDEIIKWEITDISSCMKIHSSGWIPLPADAVVDVVSSMLENAGFDRLPYVHRSGYTIVEVKEKMEDGYLLWNGEKEIPFSSEEHLEKGMLVVILEPGAFLEDGSRVEKRNLLLKNKEGQVLELEEKELIGKDFFKIRGGEK